MSYYGARPGFSEGMGAAFPVGFGVQPNEEMRAIQQSLQSSGDLPAGTGPTGANGLWGLHMPGALLHAKTRLKWPTAAFTLAPGGRTVNIPDDFIAAIQGTATTPTKTSRTLKTFSFGPDPSATPPPPPPLPTTEATPPPGWTTEATPPPSWTPPPVAFVVPPAVETAPSHMRMYLMIGGGVVVIGGVAAFLLLRKKSTPNRRRRMRRNRRRTSRR